MILTRRDFLKLGGTALVSLAFADTLPASAPNVPVLRYGNLSDDESDEDAIAPSRFAAEMEWLYSEGYRAIFPNELDALSAGDAKRAVVITFDGGYASFLDYGYPLLREYGFKAAVNVIGKYAGAFIHGNDPRLSWDECRYLQASTIVTIGCNGYDDFAPRGFLARWTRTTVLDAAVEKDLSAFQSVFKKETGAVAEVLAWPYSAEDARRVEIAKRAEFKYVLVPRPAYGTAGGAREGVPRMTVNNDIDLRSFRASIENGL